MSSDDNSESSHYNSESSDDNNETRFCPKCVLTPCGMVTFREVVEDIMENTDILYHRGIRLRALLISEFKWRVVEGFPHYNSLHEVDVPQCVWEYFDDEADIFEMWEDLEDAGYDPIDGYG